MTQATIAIPSRMEYTRTMERKNITAQSVYQEVMKHMTPDERLRLAALILNDFASTVNLLSNMKDAEPEK